MKVRSDRRICDLKLIYFGLVALEVHRLGDKYNWSSLKTKK